MIDISTLETFAESIVDLVPQNGSADVAAGSPSHDANSEALDTETIRRQMDEDDGYSDGEHEDRDWKHARTADDDGDFDVDYDEDDPRPSSEYVSERRRSSQSGASSVSGTKRPAGALFSIPVSGGGSTHSSRPYGDHQFAKRPRPSGGAYTARAPQQHHAMRPMHMAPMQQMGYAPVMGGGMAPMMAPQMMHPMSGNGGLQPIAVIGGGHQYAPTPAWTEPFYRPDASFQQPQQQQHMAAWNAGPQNNNYVQQNDGAGFGGPSHGRPRPQRPSSRPAQGHVGATTNSTIIVSKIPPAQCTVDQLSSHFKQFGAIVNLQAR